MPPISAWRCALRIASLAAQWWSEPSSRLIPIICCAWATRRNFVRSTRTAARQCQMRARFLPSKLRTLLSVPPARQTELPEAQATLLLPDLEKRTFRSAAEVCRDCP